MTNISEEIQNLLAKANGSMNDNAQLQQAIARLEATPQ